MTPLQPGPQQPQLLPEVRHAIAVSSGKGGVGKTTVSVNLAIALAKLENAVGLLDADIYGPNVPMMMGVKAQPEAVDGKIIPLENYGVKLMSLGFIAGEDTPVIWRGPIVGKIIQQFLLDVTWGALDHLVIDLPPGTGDAQLTLAQTIPLSGAVIVTTPQDVALEDVRRSIAMFQKVDVPILGVVENMSYFICPCCKDRAPIFGEGGGEKIADLFGIPLLGQIPIVLDIREGGDSGNPVTAAGAEEARTFLDIAQKVVEQVADQDDGGPQITVS